MERAGEELRDGMTTQTLTRSDAGTAEYRWTRAQYERMTEAGVLGEDDRVELIEGRIVVTWVITPRRATSIRLLQDSLGEAYSHRFMIRVRAPLAISLDLEPEPDVSVISGSPRDYLDAHPQTAVLIVEVADSSLLTDRTEKAGLYAQHGIGEYWILNVRDEVLQVYREPADGTYQTKTTLRRGDRITPPQADAEIEVADVLP